MQRLVARAAAARGPDLPGAGCRLDACATPGSADGAMSMPAAPPTPPPAPPAIRLGVPWIAACCALEIGIIAVVIVAFYLRERRRGHLAAPDSLTASGTRCGASRKQCMALLAWRAANLGWFLGCSIDDWARGNSRPGDSIDDPIWSGYFPPAYTQWAFRVQPFFWLAATMSSAFHLWPAWVERRQRLARASRAAAQATHALCLSVSWLVTLVVFCMLEPGNPRIFISRQHFINTACLTAEFCANRLPVRAGHLVLMVGWVCLYVAYSWARKAADWPRFLYWFQGLETPAALLWYPLLAALHVIVYMVLVGLSRLKERRLARGTRGAQRPAADASAAAEPEDVCWELPAPSDGGAAGAGAGGQSGGAPAPSCAVA